MGLYGLFGNRWKCLQEKSHIYHVSRRRYCRWLRWAWFKKVGKHCFLLGITKLIIILYVPTGHSKALFSLLSIHRRRCSVIISNFVAAFKDAGNENFIVVFWYFGKNPCALLFYTRISFSDFRALLIQTCQLPVLNRRLAVSSCSSLGCRRVRMSLTQNCDSSTHDWFSTLRIHSRRDTFSVDRATFWS